MTTRGQRVLLIQAVEDAVIDDVAVISAAEKREVIAALQRCIDRLEGNFRVPRNESGYVTEVERAVDDLSDAAYRLDLLIPAEGRREGRRQEWFRAHRDAWEEARLTENLAIAGERLLSAIRALVGD
jgi:hypothetical protein